MNTVNPFIKQEAVPLSLITSRRGAEGLLNHVILEHQIKSFDLEDKNIPLAFKMEKNPKPSPAHVTAAETFCRIKSFLAVSEGKKKKKKSLQTNCKLGACVIKHASLVPLICQ